MEKKSVSASLLVVYLAALFAVVGSCFYAFVFKARQIKIQSVSVEASQGINVFADKEKTKKAEKLDLSNMETGIRPATGKLDKDTQIPSTISADNTSEGYYASVFVEPANYKIVVRDIKIDSEEDELEVKEERKNIFIAIKDVEGSAKSLEDDEVELATFKDATEDTEHVFLIWLSASAGDSLKGAKISFEIAFVNV